MKIPILLKYKHRQTIKWIPLSDDLVCCLDTKYESSGTFRTVHAANLQNRLRPGPTPMPACKVERIPDQRTALTRAYKTPWCFILQGTNILFFSLSFCQVTNTPSVSELPERFCAPKRLNEPFSSELRCFATT